MILLHPPRRARSSRTLGAVAAVMLLAGCAGDDPADAPASGEDRLSVVRLADSGLLARDDLDCAGVDRDVCDRVAALLPSLVPDPDEVCAEVYGGPERIRLRGRLDGEAVAVEVTRADGCQIRRYDALTEALGP